MNNSTNKKQTYRFSGTRIEDTTDYEIEGYELVVTLSSEISRGAKEDIRDVSEDHVAVVEFEDGTEWIGLVGDLEEMFPKISNRKLEEDGVVALESYIDLSDSRGPKRLLRKLISIFKPKMAKVTAKALGEILDKRLVPEPGLYMVNEYLELKSLDKSQHLQGNILLLLHGTFSNINNSFDDLKNGGLWSDIHKQYDFVLGLNHYTVSLSPISNALFFLEQIPKGLTIDILSTSRGGLVGDLLAKYDYYNEFVGFPKEQIRLIEEDSKDEAENLRRLNKLAEDKQFSVRRMVRVACPAQGTSLLGKRADIYLNAVLNLVGIITGTRLNPTYQWMKEFVIEVFNNRHQADSFPGLWSMISSSNYQKITNLAAFEANSELYIIAGEANLSKNIKHSLLVILTELYFWTSNDFVVDTSSMTKGVRRKDGYYFYLSFDDNTHHLNYFDKSDSRRAVALALEGSNNDNSISFRKVLPETTTDRGAVQLLRPNNSITSDEVSGTRPIVIVLPGIMGSSLKDEESNIWLSLHRLSGGSFVYNLNLENPKITASGALRAYYEKIIKSFESDYDVKLFAYDWRKDLDESANQMAKLLEEYLKYDQPIQIIAHSMGGLVIKRLIVRKEKVWKDFSQNIRNRLFLLGTPWNGSHLIMEVLTGYSKRIKMLNIIDAYNTKSEILATATSFPGVLQLLPVNDEEFEKISFWNDVSSKDPKIPLQITEELLQTFAEYKRQNADFKIPDGEKKRIYYIAGSDFTIFGHTFESTLFRGNVLRFKETPLGDGSVTWDLGIPKELYLENIYYSQITHGELANKAIIFNTIKDIIKNDNSTLLPQKPPIKNFPGITRGLQEQSFVFSNEFDLIPSDDGQMLNSILGSKPEVRDEKPKIPKIKVSVLNADLKYSNHPVMVGHFYNDGLYSAERALNQYLDNRLNERHQLGFYPGKIGESEVTYLSNSQPQGALVLGLGQADSLTPYQLTLAVEKGILNYALFFRDNYKMEANREKGSAISSILLATSYAGIPYADCIRAILTGITKANAGLQQLNNNLLLIKEVEFVDYYEDIAQNCYQILKGFEPDRETFNIEVGTYKTGQGNRRRLSVNDNQNWWTTFNTNVHSNHSFASGLSFSASMGRARSEQSDTMVNLNVVEQFAREFSHNEQWDPRLAKTLFELLIPNDFKSVIRNQTNIVWKMDEYSAQFPWELFHDYLDVQNPNDEVPTFVNTGLIRQLITQTYRQNPITVSTKNALIIGDPKYEGQFNQLPGAATEANEIEQIIKKNDYQTILSVRAEAHEIIKQLYSEHFKIIHIAAHGLYEEEEINGVKRMKAGVVIGPDVLLTPGMFNQLSSIPEFVFINCCFSGDTTGLAPGYFKDRSKLAANIGIQLIEMGVKAAVITGWAVNDQAALTFSNELYAKLFAGFEFGEAVKLTRKKCYERHPSKNTWGAYQCYGDHYYKLSTKSYHLEDNSPFITENQAKIELSNLYSSIAYKRVSKKKYISKLEKISQRAKTNKLETAAVKEWFGKIYAILGEYEEAIKIFDSLLRTEKADFSVSSLEQFCSLRGKVMFTESSVSKELIDSLIYDMGVISVIGPTAERKALLGSLYKRLAKIGVNRKKDRENYLGKMRDYYLYSYLLTTKSQPEDRAYSLSNYLVSLYFLKEYEEKSQKIKEGVEDLIVSLEERNNDRNDFYQQDALPKMYLVKYLFNEDEKTFSLLKESKLFALENYANNKNVLGEIEHLNFVISMLEKAKENEEKIDRLKSLSQEIEALIIS